eukprot:scaffold143422_cov160-Phaeocystis_antarctica.AAC.1
MNSHLSTSSKRAKRTESSLPANLPIIRMSGPSAAALWSSVLLCAPTEHVEVTFGMASLFKIVVRTERGVWSSVRGGRIGGG